MERIRQGLFLALLGLSCTPWIGPPMALVLGIFLSMTLENPWPRETAIWSRRLLQYSVVGLGFGLGILQVWSVAKGAVFYTLIGIIFTVLLGQWIGARLGIPKRTASLISYGTAICGGSAIAAMAPVLDAKADETAVALATIFILNAVALLIFPPIGHFFHLSPHAFGIWSALAIHDTSSVVGAAAAFGGGALAIATTTKLARALWIMPTTLFAAWRVKAGGKVHFPLFILGFIAASTLRSLLPQFEECWQTLHVVARQGLVASLFLIGAGLSRPVLRRVGVRPLLQGIILWVVVGSLTLGAVMLGLIG